MLTKHDVTMIREAIKDEIKPIQKDLGSIHDELGSVHNDLGSIHDELGSVHKEVKKLGVKLDKTIDAFDHMHLDVVKNVRVIQSHLGLPVMDLA